MQNPQHMQQMSGMMGSGMMGQGMMMGQPLTKSDDVLNTINNIGDLLDQISSSYTKGNSNTVFSLATSAYLENYEYIESAIASKNRILMGKIGIMLRVDLRQLIKTGAPAEDIDAKIDSIKKELDTVKSLLK